MWLFEGDGLIGAFRMSHVFMAIAWMGLLWFFNFVQTPAFAKMGGPAKNEAFDHLTWRALWWFRWAAAFTWITGLLMLAIGPALDNAIYDGDYWKSTSGQVLVAAIVLAFLMLMNVWMIIWPNQRIVIGNARNVLAGKEADPAAADAARKAAMASRQNTIFSFTVVAFMVGASHFWGSSGFEFQPESGNRIVWYIVILAIAVLMELNALGIIGGFGAGGTNVIYDTHQNAIYAGVGILVVLYFLTEILFGA
jgi:hypothetical protein